MQQLILDIETTGFNPMEERITCISYMTDDGTIKTVFNEDEKILLEDFSKILLEENLVITFNGNNFDIPFILKRCLIHNVKIAKFITLDLARVVNGSDFTLKTIDYGSLDAWSKILTGNSKTENGKQCVEYFHNKEYNKLIKHCEEDIKITKLLLERCQSIGLV